MPPVGFETTILAGERPKTYALDRAATGTSLYYTVSYFNKNFVVADLQSGLSLLNT